MAATKGSFEALNAWLNRQVGIMEHPVGSNCQVYSHALHRPCEFWCQDFAACAAIQNGVNVFGAEKTAYTPDAAKAYQRAGRYGSTPRLGAQGFVYHQSQGRIAHTFWVVSVGLGGKTIVTVEGNSNDDGSRNGVGVFRLNRKVDAHLTFGYPAYKTVAVPAKPTAPPAKGKPQPHPTLRQGSRGQYVLELQHRLQHVGIRCATDGDFGPATKADVVKFQKKEGLGADGVVGNATWSALLRVS